MNELFLKGLAEAIIPYLMPYFENKVRDEIQSFSSIQKEDNPVFLTKNQVMKSYQVSAMTLWRFEQEGKLIPVRMGRKVMYRPKDVEKLFT